LKAPDSDSEENISFNWIKPGECFVDYQLFCRESNNNSTANSIEPFISKEQQEGQCNNLSPGTKYDISLNFTQNGSTQILANAYTSKLSSFFRLSI
jgi:hypothetical protein